MAARHAGPTMEEVVRRLDQSVACEFFASGKSRLPGSPGFLNAQGVSLVRLGKVYEALTVFNEIAMEPGTLRVRRDVPDSFKTNLAMARLMAKNPKGCLEALRVVGNRRREYCQRLTTAVLHGSACLPLPQRFGVASGRPAENAASAGLCARRT